MVARAIQHDRPDVRVVTVTEAQATEGYVAHLLAHETWDGWEERATPLTQEESATMELVVLLVVRPCRGAREHDTTVVEPPWVMRVPLPETTEPPRRVVVLDVDGVLHPLNEKGLPLHAALEDLYARADEDHSAADGEEEDDGERLATTVEGEFLPSCMGELARAVAETGADIVLSSTWRETPPERRAVDAKLEENFMPASVGCTPRLSVLRGGRAAEILAWASEMPADTRWVALDDVDLRLGPVRLPPERFIHVDPRTGLTAADADVLIARLTDGSMKCMNREKS